MAYQYGMTTHEFWHGDLRELKARQQAYYRDVQYRAWWNGQYGFSGTNGAIYNGFSTNAKNSPYKYPQYEDFTDKLFEQKTKITKENLEYEFRKQQVSQQQWLHEILNR